MADIKLALTFVLRHEDAELSGVVTTEPNGGKARFGVNSIAHPEAEKQGFYEMSRDAALQWASDLFKYDYWNPVAGYNLADQNVANKVADLAFNTGVHEGTKILQKAINSLRDPGKGVVIDGMAGAHTIAQANALEPAELLKAIKEQAKNFYLQLQAARPNVYSTELRDAWFKRVDE